MLGLEREAFYNLCFITENDEAPREIVVSKLKDLLDNNYSRTSLAYNFCVGAFSQEGIQSVTVRAKRSGETYQQAFDAADNNSYYFIVIDSKYETIINTFANHIEFEPYKLLFYSTPTSSLANTKTVHYYQSMIPTESVTDNKTTLDNLYINSAYNLGYEVVDLDEATASQLQMTRLAYQ